MPTLRANASCLVTSLSPKKIFPEVGANKPEIIISVVDFPQPLGPKIETKVPSGIVKFK